MTVLVSGGPDKVLAETPPIPLVSRSRGRIATVAGLLLGAAWTSTTALLVYVGYHAVYAFFGPYDDEGYWLISLRSYQLHGSLYHDTFSQAGPLYYEFWSLVYSVLGIPINWETGRMLTLIVWVATSVTMGIAIWILSRRVLLGLLAEVVSFLALFLLSSVAMEPAGLAHFFAAVVLLGLALHSRRKSRAAMILIGLGSTAAVFTKVNIGAFVVIGLVAAVTLTWPNRRTLRTRKVVVAAGLLLVPIVITAQVLQTHWALSYCMLELLYLIGLGAIVLPGDTFKVRPTQRAGEIHAALITSAATALLIAIGIVASGTSLWQFIYGTFFSQRGLARAFLHQRQIVLPLTFPEVAATVLSSALALFIGVWSHKRGERHPWFSSVASGYVRLAAGAWILLSIAQGIAGWTFVGLVLAPGLSTPIPGISFILAAPFAWVALLGGKDEESDQRRFVRIAICLIGVLACLEGFPVAGAQMLWASLGLVPVGVLCIADGLSLIPRNDRGPHHAVHSLRPSFGSALVAALTLSLTLGTVGRTLNIWQNAYHEGESLGLPGTAHVRLPHPEVKQFQLVTDFLKTHCSTYWSIPGLNSFYLFSGETPPTGLNTTQSWWNALSWNEQRSVLGALVHTPRLCVIEATDPIVWDHKFRHIVQTPLVHYLETRFVVAERTARYGPWSYQLLIRSTDHNVVHP
jgi:hypothetical protein